jgi:hypothetical protein
MEKAKQALAFEASSPKIMGFCILISIKRKNSTFLTLLSCALNTVVYFLNFTSLKPNFKRKNVMIKIIKLMIIMANNSP